MSRSVSAGEKGWWWWRGMGASERAVGEGGVKGGVGGGGAEYE